MTSTSSVETQTVPPAWVLGNCNGDSYLDVSDVVFALDHIFSGKHPNLCYPLCDANGDNRLDVSDPVSIINWLFRGAPLAGTLPSAEEPCDGEDNDCDGAVDEDCPSLTLSWDPVTLDVEGQPESIVGYTIHFGEQSGTYTQTVEAGNVTTFTVTGLLPGVRYYFAVTARDFAGNTSDFSNEVSGVGN